MDLKLAMRIRNCASLKTLQTWALALTNKVRARGLAWSASCAVVVLYLCVLAACADKPCREARRPELDRTGDPENVASQQPLSRTPGRVWVSRPDGSLQCQNGSGKTVAESARDLAGVVVYKRETRLDGLMRVQLCGTPTGRLHVFEIDARRLREAERRGFTLYQSTDDKAGE